MQLTRFMGDAANSASKHLQLNFKPTWRGRTWASCSRLPRKSEGLGRNRAWRGSLSSPAQPRSCPPCPPVARCHSDLIWQRACNSQGRPHLEIILNYFYSVSYFPCLIFIIILFQSLAFFYFIFELFFAWHFVKLINSFKQFAHSVFLNLNFWK